MQYLQREMISKTVFDNTVPLSASAVYSSGIETDRGEFFSFWVSATPSSAVSAGAITLWYEQAPSDSASLYMCAGKIMAGVSALSGGTHGTASAFSITPIKLPYMRFGISATSGSNLSTNQISAYGKLFVI